MNRRALLRLLASEILSIQSAGPLRVAIDGPDAAGKTTLADELAGALRHAKRHVIRASVDGFHRPSARRYKRGHLSPQGYVLDSFDYDTLIAWLLAPLGPGGSRRYRTSSFDHRLDQPDVAPEQVAPEDAILLFDGIFLLQPFLIPYWDFSIYLQVSEETVLARAIQRDAEDIGGEENVRERYRARYLPAHKIYTEACRPRSAASIVVDNNNPHEAFILNPDVSTFRAH